MPTILIQKGHHAPREPGFEQQRGATGEREVVGVIADRLTALLAGDSRFVAVTIPGRIPTGIRAGARTVDAFLSLHCDGSTDPSRRGWGVGYPDGAVNRKLADLVGEELARVHPSARLRDNYSPNMSGYYGWSRVPTSGPEVLVEHGFSSTPAEKNWMLGNAARLAQAEYRALLRYFTLPVKPPRPAVTWITPKQAREAWEPSEPIWQTLPGPKGKPAWFWQAELELQRRRAVLRGQR